MKKLSLTLLTFLLSFNVAFAQVGGVTDFSPLKLAPFNSINYIVPKISTWIFGTSTMSAIFKSSTTTSATTTNFAVTSQGTGCAQFSSIGGLTTTGVACGSGSGTVTSVGLSDSNSTLTIGSTPVTTSGTITATLNLTNANTWTGLQTFNSVTYSALFNGGNVGISTSTPGQKLSVGGDILGNNIIGQYFTSTSTTATSTFLGSVKLQSTGTNPIVGNATLIGGTVTVNTAAATANSFVLLTRKASGGTIGTAITYTITAGSFTINSDSPIDTSTFTWLLIQ